MEKININFETSKDKPKKDNPYLIEAVSDCFGIPKSVLKKVFGE